ncbi:FAD-binding oxidoreductase [Siminovitchia sediminis]|uniref:FAD-binding oxidoreductase n=1 Tax=Siminovitchia sediminis TaxID=1274353 RepID=A0ABW4KF17_9BACI
MEVGPIQTTSVLDELKSVIPEERITDRVIRDQLGNGGNVIVSPQTEEETAKLLSYANQTDQTVSIMGAGTKRGYGGLIESTDILLCMKNYHGIVEHVPGDMTVTVKAGTRFSELQNYLAQYNQKVPIDPFTPSASTVGGVIAANDSGPKRLGYGSARDSVIGMRIIYPDGKLIRTGGKVVKNVAGYDMNKLFIGSMGTLGVISEVTFKLRPIPKCESLVLLTIPEDSLDIIKQFSASLLDSMIEPVALELMNPALVETLDGIRNTALAIAFEDVESSVLYQENRIKDMKPDAAEIRIFSEKDSQEVWKRFYEYPLKESSDLLQSTMKIGAVNMDVLSIIEETMKLENPGSLDIQAHGGLGHGLCKVYLKGKPGLVSDAILQLRKKAEEKGGYATVTHLPLEYRKEIDVWGEKPPYFFLMEGIKKTIDPKRILNPQRFLGGI